MTTSRSKILTITIVTSVLVHIVAFAALTYRQKQKAAGHKGLIEVDFVESVPHHESASENHEKSHEVAKPSAPNPQPAVAPQTGRTATPEEVTQLTEAYVQSVMQLIAAKKIYPREALDRGQQGRVMVAVHVSREGTVSEVNVEETSPFESLNSAALQTIQTVGRFPSVPAELETPLHLHIPLIFKIEQR